MEPRHLLAEARAVLREKYFAAEVGITGANMLIAETGQSVIVTNEGNGDLTQSLARVHIVMASLEKIVPTLDDAATVLRVLARSATGQEMSVYTTFSSGPRRAADPDGPEEYHVVLLDNGRTNMLGTDFQDMLRCIRCGACMNHCPVYKAVGGHAYGWVYPGPMGCGADAVADRRRGGRAIAERLDLLRALRGGVPDAHSAAAHDARLPGDGIRQGPDPGRGAPRAGRVADDRRPAGTLPQGQRGDEPGAGLARPCPRQLRVAAAGLGLDRPPRHAGARARRHVPEPVGEAAMRPKAMTDEKPARVAGGAPTDQAGRWRRDRPNRAARHGNRCTAPDCAAPHRSVDLAATLTRLAGP